ncbi:MAG: 6-phosphogluconolactonase [bacterium]|nr:6-phosphogluconolactonase [bacterium]MCP5069175.1 6-phosphogluconolactonase [bacterium]
MALGGIHIERFRNQAGVASAAAEFLTEVASKAIEQRGRFRLVLSGGSTPGHLYSLLGSASQPLVSWEHVDFFFGDERAVPPDHADSNYRFAQDGLLGPIHATSAQVHRMHGEASDLVAASEDYQREIASVFGSDPMGEPPRFDLVLLGMGTDGHTASLFPGSTALAETHRWVAPNHPAGLVPRITLTLPILQRAREVLFLVTGPDKATKLAEVLAGPRRPRDLPAQAVVPRDGALTWFVDEAAAAALPQALEAS